MVDLFTRGDFTLHSGARSDFKIDCDALSDTDLATLAYLMFTRLPPFGYVHGVPRGGIPLALHLDQYCVGRCTTLLIVDDVLTTGGSMKKARRQFHPAFFPMPFGAVILARGPCPDWIMPLFQITNQGGEF